MTDEEQEEQEQEEQEQEEQEQSLEDELETIRSDPAGARRTMEGLRGEAMDYRKKLRRAEAELERVKTEGLSEQERAVAEAEARGRASAEAEHGRSLLEAQVLAAAAGKLRDPADAVRYLDLGELLELDTDERELGKRLDKLVDDKPYLGLSENGGTKRVGVQSQGARTAPGATKDADADGNAWLRKAARGRR